MYMEDLSSILNMQGIPALSLVSRRPAGRIKSMPKLYGAMQRQELNSRGLRWENLKNVLDFKHTKPALGRSSTDNRLMIGKRKENGWSKAGGRGRIEDVRS